MSALDGFDAAVLGHPVAHSLSPLLHEAAYRELGLDWHYERRDVAPEQWDEFWTGALAQPRWRGLSVTMPLKPHAAAAAQQRTEWVRALGVANTLVRAERGTVVADNTDVLGVAAAVLAAADVPHRPRWAVLGGGGTATAALAAGHGLGAPSVTVFSRSRERAASVSDAAAHLGARLTWRPWHEAAHALGDFDVVVSTLPPHGADELAATFAAAQNEHGGSGLRVVPGRDTRRAGVSGAVLLDVAYDPWPSVLATAWQDAGGAVAPGIDMLIFQAVDQVRWFTQGRPDRALPHEDRVTRAMCRAVQRPPRVIPQRARAMSTHA